METLWTLYHPEIPLFLEKFSCMSSVMRLRDVGMNCGCEYTAFPRFAEIGRYSRYEHSLGVALIVWHFSTVIICTRNPRRRGPGSALPVRRS